MKLLCGDVIEMLKTVQDKSVQTCVTSPPYYGLRDYGVTGQIGLESTPKEYISKLVEVFREVKRVLRDDGTLWVNIGDSYNSHSTGNGGVGGIEGKRKNKDDNRANTYRGDVGCKDKDLLGIPWMLAFALRDDGWYLRSEIIWAKPNPMPESVKDRPTKSHEQIFLFAKNQHYFYDEEAVKEPFTDDRAGNPGAYKWGYANNPETGKGVRGNGGSSKKLQTEGWNADGKITGRNQRSVWTITTKPFKGAHFAVFPPEIPERCIKAGTSEKGCCPKCGSPWERVVDDRSIKEHDGKTQSEYGQGTSANRLAQLRQSAREKGGEYSRNILTIGWMPSCDCAGKENIYYCPSCNVKEHIDNLKSGCPKCGKTMIPLPLDPVPCVVLDPFNGSGTTGVVAKSLGRDCIGIDLNPEYIEMARKRIDAVVYQPKLAVEI